MSRRPSVVLQQNRDLIRNVALLHRTVNLRVFGSVVHGDDTETSDLDLLVDPLPGATLLTWAPFKLSWKNRSASR